MRRTLLLTALLGFVFGSAQAAVVEHDCNWPGPWWSQIHQNDERADCTNHTSTGITAAGHCTHEVSTTTLQRGEYMVCSPDALPNQAAGCDLTVVRYCGQSKRAGEISCGMSYDGTYPVIGPTILNTDDKGQLNGYWCNTKDTASTGHAQYCGCFDHGTPSVASDDTWECPVSF